MITKICTDIDQSKKMAEILPLESADMWFASDEKVRKELIDAIQGLWDNDVLPMPLSVKRKEAWLSWLERQGGNNNQNWKPSKEEMDVLYGLAYITNQYDEHKEEVITRLYQDLKREFFNGASYENMFPNTEDDVRRKSIIQILEYARSLDAYNQYGKEDIDKNIVWLEKRGEQKPFDYENANIQQKDFAPKDEPKLKIEKGKWYVCIRELLDDYGNRAFCKGDVYLSEKDGYLIPCNSNVPWELSYCLDTYFRNWDISDAKDGDVLVYNNSSVEIILLFKKWMNGVGDGAYSYAHTFDNKIRFNDWSDCGYTAHPATKEQRDFLFQKMKESGYEWNEEKKELMKIERKPTWSEEDEHRAKDTIYFLDTAKKHYASTVELDACIDWIKSLKKRMEKEVVV